MSGRVAALQPVTLVLGGARSGKSGFAESLVTQAAPSWLYIATGQAWDAEMGERIARHQDRRGDGWTTIEEPLDLASVLKRESRPDRPVLVDCLTLWLTNLMLADKSVDLEVDALLAALPGLAGPMVLVSNEVGLGIVPENAMARAFRDHAGRAHQKIAAIAETVYFVTAGLPLKMKG
ncbi:adenosylcobinamide kinase /adenosylcobinamide-phosphate guanylyltransferase [Hoeflea marina]|uniref:Bifunctional adenosylcobalamin biosynthesis protein n=1 Tax=Hoeflea marina TaxID=274592 RepID=A0A317PHS5_9HYPH|nr:bifunctional adenosylcobinamide kinase/adenosylcobinamide-phosphate guanylyltransferase [Hoeflea marina]PWV98988.1 adenosylcobinamide kinase /adenosylcobinamide-phosphate guanylyltransferase [Hoeflea marina]